MEQPKRRSQRLQNFDYSQNGAYFITICTQNRENIFGKIENSTVVHSPMGEIACREIDVTNEKRKHQGITVEKYVVMPNHVHMMISIVVSRLDVTQPRVNDFSQSISKSLSVIVGGYKSAVTRHIREWCKICNGDTASHVPTTIWQPKFYDHVIRGQEDYDNIWNYIDTNPLKWELDRFYEKEGSL